MKFFRVKPAKERKVVFLRKRWLAIPGAGETMDMWANVRRGEKLYISPFKHRANYIFDSSLPYEVSVMKHYAMPLLEAVPQENVRRRELLDLIHGFEHFLPIDPALVPPASLLREFIGGGIYDYT